jgi:glutathione peroxidase-family protein
MRKSEAKQGAIGGTLGRIREEGLDGAAIRSYGDRIPIIDFPEDVEEFHRAWLKLEPEHKRIVYVDYKLRIPIAKKLELVGKKKDPYYRLRSNALTAIMYLMER